MSLLCLKSVNLHASLPPTKVSYDWRPQLSKCLRESVCSFLTKHSNGRFTPFLVKTCHWLDEPSPGFTKSVQICQLLLMLNLMLLLTDERKAMKKEYLIFNVKLNGFLFKNPFNAPMAAWQWEDLSSFFRTWSSSCIPSTDRLLPPTLGWRVVLRGLQLCAVRKFL